jgi:hypothetical protein
MEDYTMLRSAARRPKKVPADSKPTLDAITKNIGFTPDTMATFAQSPIAFNAWAALLGSLSKALDVKTRVSIGPRCLRSEWLQLLPVGSQLYGRTYGQVSGR